MPAYGNNSGIVRGVNTAIAVGWKAFICIVLGPGILYLDIASGANYFQKAFEPYLKGGIETTLPLLGWHVNWSKAETLGFLLSTVTSALQIVLWNYSKSGVKLRQLNPHHIVALVFAGTIFLLDVASDLGGATLWVSKTKNGGLWPQDANTFQIITIPVIVLSGVANEAILDFFFGIDQPTKLGQLLERKRSSVAERRTAA